MTDLADFRKARSMLVILLATCQQTLLTLKAAGNVLDSDSDMAEDLSAMIERSQAELARLKVKIEAASA